MATYKSVSFLGTSISNGYFDEDGSGGWVARLFKKLNTDKPGSYYLCNLARSGDRSYDYWHRLCGEAIQRQTDVLMIEVSCNDLVRQQSLESPTDLSIGIRTELWQNILQTAQKNFPEIYVFSGYPKNETRMAATRTLEWNVWYANADIAAWNRHVQELCGGYNIPFIDLYTDLSQSDYIKTLDDAVHPNSVGHEMIATLALQKLKALGFQPLTLPAVRGPSLSPRGRVS